MNLNLDPRAAKDLAQDFGGALTSLPKAPKNAIIPDRAVLTPGPEARGDQKAFVTAVAKLYKTTAKQVQNEVLKTDLGEHLWNMWQAGEVHFPSVLPLAPEPPAWAREKISEEALSEQLGQVGQAKMPLQTLQKRPAEKPARNVNPQLEDTAVSGGRATKGQPTLHSSYVEVRSAALARWESVPNNERNQLTALITALDKSYAALNKTTFDRSQTHIDISHGPGLALNQALNAVRAKLD